MNFCANICFSLTSLDFVNTKSNDVNEKQMLAQKFIVELQYGNHVDTDEVAQLQFIHFFVMVKFT